MEGVSLSCLPGAKIGVLGNTTAPGKIDFDAYHGRPRQRIYRRGARGAGRCAGWLRASGTSTRWSRELSLKMSWTALREVGELRQRFDEISARTLPMCPMMMK